jgi:hypothetical protein
MMSFERGVVRCRCANDAEVAICIEQRCSMSAIDEHALALTPALQQVFPDTCKNLEFP